MSKQFRIKSVFRARDVCRRNSIVIRFRMIILHISHAYWAWIYLKPKTSGRILTLNIWIKIIILGLGESKLKYTTDLKEEGSLYLLEGDIVLLKNKLYIDILVEQTEDGEKCYDNPANFIHFLKGSISPYLSFFHMTPDLNNHSSVNIRIIQFFSFTLFADYNQKSTIYFSYESKFICRHYIS